MSNHLFPGEAHSGQRARRTKCRALKEISIGAPASGPARFKNQRARGRGRRSNFAEISESALAAGTILFGALNPFFHW
jgi:hypothetical protein